MKIKVLISFKQFSAQISVYHDVFVFTKGILGKVVSESENRLFGDFQS